MGLFTKKSRYWQQKLERFTPKAPPIMAEAFKIFDHLAALPNIAFNFPYIGCQARTHLLCQELVKRSHMPAKAWIFEGDKGPMTIQLPAHTVHARYNWHVAPVLMVDAGLPGGPIPMILDPALFDGPVTCQQWATLMGRKAKHLHVVPLGHSAPGHHGDYLPFTSRDKHAPNAFTNAQTDDVAKQALQKLKSACADRRAVFSCGLRPWLEKDTWYTAAEITETLVAAAVTKNQLQPTHSLRL